MQAIGISQEKLAIVLECTRGAVGHYLAGRRSPTLFQLEVIATELQVDPCWLIFGTDKVRENGSRYRVSNADSYTFPLRGGTNRDANTADLPSVELASCSDQAYAMLIEGNQWAPRYYEGEIILICPTKEPLPGYELLVNNRDKSMDLLTLVRIEKKRIIFDGLTEQRKRHIRQKNTIESMHCVIGVLREAAVSADPE